MTTYDDADLTSQLAEIETSQALDALFPGLGTLFDALNELEEASYQPMPAYEPERLTPRQVAQAIQPLPPFAMGGMRQRRRMR